MDKGIAHNRDLRQWPYAHQLWNGNKLLIETIHKSKISLQVELMASRSRIAKGEATKIIVDGVPDDEWETWQHRGED